MKRKIKTLKQFKKGYQDGRMYIYYIFDGYIPIDPRNFFQEESFKKIIKNKFRLVFDSRINDYEFDDMNKRLYFLDNTRRSIKSRVLSWLSKK